MQRHHEYQRTGRGSALALAAAIVGTAQLSHAAQPDPRLMVRLDEARALVDALWAGRAAAERGQVPTPPTGVVLAPGRDGLPRVATVASDATIRAEIICSRGLSEVAIRGADGQTTHSFSSSGKDQTGSHYVSRNEQLRLEWVPPVYTRDKRGAESGESRSEHPDATVELRWGGGRPRSTSVTYPDRAFMRISRGQGFWGWLRGEHYSWAGSFDPATNEVAARYKEGVSRRVLLPGLRALVLRHSVAARRWARPGTTPFTGKPQ